jgi:hypothetical protein
MIQPAFQSQSWTESSKLGLTVDAPWMVTPFSSLTPHVLLTPISRPTAHAKLHRKTLRSMIFSDRRRDVYKSNSHRGSRTCAHRGPQTGFEEIRSIAVSRGSTRRPRSGLFGRASESQVTVASSVFAPEIRSAPRRCLTRASSRSLITQHFFLFARAIRPQ